MESGVREYFVHYSGWNTRYDEWISEDKVATRLAAGSNERTRPSIAKVANKILQRVCYDMLLVILPVQYCIH